MPGSTRHRPARAVLELRVRVVNCAGALELLLVAPVEGERGVQQGARLVRRERAEEIEPSLDRLVQGTTAVHEGERPPVSLLDGERHELGVPRKESP